LFSHRHGARHTRLWSSHTSQANLQMTRCTGRGEESGARSEERGARSEERGARRKAGGRRHEHHSIVAGSRPAARKGSSIFSQAQTLVAFQVAQDLQRAMRHERAPGDQLLGPRQSHINGLALRGARGMGVGCLGLEGGLGRLIRQLLARVKQEARVERVLGGRVTKHGMRLRPQACF